MDSILGTITPEQFLSVYWQKKPLLIRQALPQFISPISADELAGLALEEEVESRLVQQSKNGALEVQHGPFSEKQLQQLPKSGWTLLVQAVDQFVPEVAALLQHFSFLPRWRMDDVMLSLAAHGGTVGAHFDQYDVFLLQGAGKKRWQLGEKCSEDSPLLPHKDLKLLAEMQVTDEWLLEPGDMLYLPPQIAHCGISESEELGITLSIGFRAPSQAEVISHYGDFFAQFLPEQARYSDSDTLPCTDFSQIGADVVPRLKAILKPLLEDDARLLQWFGQWMTEPRYPERLFGEDCEQKSLLKRLKQGKRLRQNPSTRLAWAQTADGALLFASGLSRYLSERLMPLLKLICQSPELSAAELGAWLIDNEAQQLLVALIEQGSLELVDE